MFIDQLFNTDGFPPRWLCGQWSGSLGWTHIVSDTAIWAAYYILPVVMGFYLLKKKNILFPKMIVLFGLFILACGTTHLIEAIIFWHPLYRLSAVVKALTALVSWMTVFAALKVLPKLLEFSSPEELNRQLNERTAQLKQAKEEAEHLAKVKGDFLANMSHEIRTPLSAIVGYTDLLLLKSHELETREDLTHIKSASNTLRTIIDDILDLSKIESGHMSVELIPFNLNHLVRNTARLFKLKVTDNLAFSVETTGIKANNLIGDANRIQQILCNFLSNAFKFTDTGSVKLIVSSSESSEGKSLVTFMVRDTGKGIKKEKLNHIFSAFTQEEASTSRSYGGTGLGLTISKNLAELMNGTITVDSTYEKGSTFVLELTLPTTDAEENIKQQLDITPSDLSDLKVLLAEDNLTNQNVITRLLHQYRIKPDIAENGSQVLKQVEKKAYDIIFMDCQMPEVDGYEATITLREQGFTKPIVALTANVFEHSKKQCRDSGMSHFIAKPINPAELHSILITIEKERNKV